MGSALAIQFEPQARPATAILRLRGRAGFRESARLRDSLFEAMAVTADKNLVVELSEVNRMDTASMAVLVESLIATRESGPDIFLVSPSESVRKVFHLAGLEEALTRCFDCWSDLEKAVAA